MSKLLINIYLMLFLITSSGCLAYGNDFLALGPDSDQPINITSKRFTAKNVTGGKEVTFEGTVKVQQGDLTLTSDRLTILYDEKQGTGNGTSSLKKAPKELQTASGIKTIVASGRTVAE